jgi:hypothetical protein
MASPRWLSAKFSSPCSKCGNVIKKGDRVFYYPGSKSVQCSADTCGGQSSRDYDAACFDEANCSW